MVRLTAIAERRYREKENRADRCRKGLVESTPVVLGYAGSAVSVRGVTTPVAETVAVSVTLVACVGLLLVETSAVVVVALATETMSAFTVLTEP